MLAIGILVTFAACTGGQDAVPTATVPPPTATTIAASPTPDPLAATEVNAARAFEHVRHLSEDIGARVAGTPGEIEARDYIQRELASYGYDVTIDDFPFDATAFLPALVTVGPQSFGAIAFNGSPAATASGTLVAAGLGRPEDFPPGGLAGGIALIERGDGVQFTEKAANAIAAGAGGVIIYNNDAGSLIGRIQPVTGVPVVAVTQEDGAALRAAAGSAVSARVQVTPPQGIAFNVVAKPQGETACQTISGGHYDSVPITGGADDNASGSGAVIELARVLAARKQTAGNCFVLFGAEEVGLIGSRAFVAEMDATALSTLRAMLNLDVVGVDLRLSLIGSPDLVDIARIAADAQGIDAIPATLPARSGSDHLSFQAAGVPVIMFNRPDTRIHTTDDTIARIEPARLGESIELALAVLDELRAEP